MKDKQEINNTKKDKRFKSQERKREREKERKREREKERKRKREKERKREIIFFYNIIFIIFQC